MTRINRLRTPGPGETAHAACCPFTVRAGGGEEARQLEVHRRGLDRTTRGVSLSAHMLAGERAIQCMQTRITLGADLTLSTTRASSSIPGRGVEPKVQAVSVQTRESRR